MGHKNNTFRNHKLDRKQILDGMIADKLLGYNQVEIAEKYGTSQPNVSRILSRKDIKEILDNSASQFVSKIPSVVKAYDDFMTDDDHRIRLEACRDVLKLTGLMASPAQTSVVVNMLNVNASSVPPVIGELISGLQGRDGGQNLAISDGQESLAQGEIIDADTGEIC